MRLGLEFAPFEPHPWLRGGAWMTTVGALPRPGLGAFAARARQRIVRVDEHTRVRVAFDAPAAPSASPPGLLILHGLVGSSEAEYALGTARKACAAGFLVARLNARNCGGTEALTTRPYNGYDTADIEAAAQALLAAGARSVQVVGFSVGANQVTRWLTEPAPTPRPWLRGAALVSPCLDFAASTEHIRASRFGRLVEARFLERMHAILHRRRELHADALEGAPARVARTIREFDERFTAPLSGFRDAAHYYRHARTDQRLAAIEVPTLLVAAADDPLVPIASLGDPVAAPNVLPLLTERGGHVAFLAHRRARNEAAQDSDRYWAENRVVQFALACAAR